MAIASHSEEGELVPGILNQDIHLAMTEARRGRPGH